MSIYLPRVSEVLAMLYPGSLAFVPQEALDAGTALHDEMECWANNRIQGFVDHGLNDERAERAIKFLDDLGFIPEDTEFRLTSKMGYCGTIDIKGQIDRERWILDFKFADVITEANRLQIEAYFRMAKEHGKVDKAGLLHVPKAGDVRLLRHRSNTRLWSAFISGCNVLRFQQAQRPVFVLETIEPMESFL